MCVNYGGRAELADAARSMGRDVAAGRLDPDKIDERTFARHLYVPELSDADLVWRTSGEQRLSNFMLWQAAYSELVFTDVLWPDVDRRHLWQAVETVRPPRPPLRRGAAQRLSAGVRPTSACQRSRLAPAARRREPGVSAAGRCRRSPACGETSAKPCSAAIALVQRSTAGPSTSTVAPHSRHTRWWWWVSEQRR